MRVLPVVLFAAGVVLMYAAVKNQDPRDVIRGALGQKTTGAVLVSNPTPSAPSAGTSPVATPSVPFSIPPGTHVTTV